MDVTGTGAITAIGAIMTAFAAICTAGFAFLRGRSADDASALREAHSRGDRLAEANAELVTQLANANADNRVLQAHVANLERDLASANCRPIERRTDP